MSQPSTVERSAYEGVLVGRPPSILRASSMAQELCDGKVPCKSSNPDPVSQAPFELLKDELDAYDFERHE